MARPSYHRSALPSLCECFHLPHQQNLRKTELPTITANFLYSTFGSVSLRHFRIVISTSVYKNVNSTIKNIK